MLTIILSAAIALMMVHLLVVFFGSLWLDYFTPSTADTKVQCGLSIAFILGAIALKYLGAV